MEVHALTTVQEGGVQRVVEVVGGMHVCDLEREFVIDVEPLHRAELRNNLILELKTLVHQ